MNTYTKITEVNLSAFAYRLFHKDFSSIVRTKFSLIYICRRTMFWNSQRQRAQLKALYT